MEQFLRNYYTNLNPNATEEEILAFLASQGFGGMGDFSGQTSIGTGGITNLRRQIPQQQEFGNDGGINNIITGRNLPVGAKPPGLIERTLATIFAPPVGITMNLQALADKGKLPFGLNKVLGSRASGNVELDLEPQMSDIFTAKSLSDSFAGEEGPTENIVGSISPGGTDDTPGTPF